MYLLLSIVLSQIIFSVHGLPDCLDGDYDADGVYHGIEFKERLKKECDCFGHTCEKGKTCVISQHATLGKFTGKGWCLETASDMFIVLQQAKKTASDMLKLSDWVQG